MSVSSPLIEVRALSRVFVRGDEEIRALDRVDLTIRQGEFVSITGASGSGKSTLMYILGLIDRQTSGTYYLSGILTDSLSDDQRAKLRNQRLGFVFQGFHLLPRASALRNVAMPLVYAGSHGSPIAEVEAQRRAQIALERVGMGDRLHHRPNELSGGQRQRVAIARALVNNPEVLFADEPTGNLDSKKGKEIIELFRDLNRTGVSIILVTHDPQLAAQAARQIVMRDGSVYSDSGGQNALA